MTVSESARGPIRRVVVVAKIGNADGARIAGELGEWLEAREIEVDDVRS